MEKIRVIFISSVRPEPTSAGQIILYRHFCNRPEFDLEVYGFEPTKFSFRMLLRRLLGKIAQFGGIFETLVNFAWVLWKGRWIDENLPTKIECDQKTIVGTVAHGDGFYAACDLAFCTSDGMQEELGPHPNSHVIYPMPGWHKVSEKRFPPATGKFRIVYVGAAEGFYGRMLRSLMHELAKRPVLELIIVGPHSDWPEEDKTVAREKGTCLGFQPPEKAAAVLAGADALLVVMSFEREHELFMRTSFTTKFLDYSAFAKPVILWGPNYCTPSRLAKREEAALVVETESPEGVIAAAKKLMDNPIEVERLSAASRRLSQTVFSPDRLQGIFVGEIEELVQQSSRGGMDNGG